MANTNSVTLVGNLVDDPELRFTPAGVAVAKLRLAVNRRWQDQAQQWQEETSFFTGSCWREAAENVAESLQKGARVIVVGRLQQRSWETEQGEKRSVVEIQIDEIGPALRWATAQVTKTPRTGGEWSDNNSKTAAVPVAVGKEEYGPDETPF